MQPYTYLADFLPTGGEIKSLPAIIDCTGLAYSFKNYDECPMSFYDNNGIYPSPEPEDLSYQCQPNQSYFTPTFYEGDGETQLIMEATSQNPFTWTGEIKILYQGEVACVLQNITLSKE